MNGWSASGKRGKSASASWRRSLRSLSDAVWSTDPKQLAWQISDAGLVVCVFLVPLLLGGRHDFAHLIYALGASLVAMGAIAHAELSGKQFKVHGPLLAFIAVTAALLTLQVLPLPASVLRLFGADQGALLPLWGEGAPFGAWNRLSFTPAATLKGLALWLSHGLLLVGVYARLRELQDIERLLKWIALASLGMALIGFAQYAVPNGKLLWVYDHPFEQFGVDVQGAFANKNHFAHFMILGLGPALWLAAQAKPAKGKTGKPTGSQIAWLMAPTALLIAIFASQSRGGVLALAGALLAAAPIFWKTGQVKLPQMIAVALVTLGAVVGVSYYGYGTVGDRMDDLIHGRIEKLDAQHARRSIWQANAEAFAASPWVGFGAGSHREVYPLFLEEDFSREFTHAESGYLQIASETGSAGLLILLGAIATVVATAVKGITRPLDKKTGLLWIAIAAGLVASLVHSLYDFVWYLPGLLGVTLILVVCALRLEQLTRTAERTAAWTSTAPPRVGLAMAAVASVVACVTCFGPARASVSWDSYARSSVALRGMTQRLTKNLTDKRDPMLSQTVVTTTARTTGFLEEVTRSNHSHARAHLRLAGRLLQRYELENEDAPNPMPLTAVRDAALSGGFASHADMQAWLDRALGERAQWLRAAHAHAVTALRLCPLQGEAYLYLADLCFLAPGGPTPQGLVQQAITVRPHDGSVQFEAGRQCYLAGDLEAGLDLWKSCARQPGSHLFKLVALVSRSASAEFFVKRIDPGYEAVELALKQYQIYGSPQDLEVLCDHALSEAENADRQGEIPSQELASRWRHASESLRMVERFEEAIQCSERALQLAPNDFWVRLEAVRAYRDAERFDDSDPHIRWCLARRPDIRYLRSWLQESAKRRTLVDQNRRGRMRLYEELASRPSEPAKLQSIPRLQPPAETLR